MTSVHGETGVTREFAGFPRNAASSLESGGRLSSELGRELGGPSKPVYAWRAKTGGRVWEKHSGCGSLARKTNHSNGGAKSGLNGKEIDGSQFYVIKIPINAKTARSTAWELALSFSMRHHRSGNTTPAYMCGRFPVVCQWVAKRAQ